MLLVALGRQPAPRRTSPSWCDLGQGVDPDLHKRLVGEVRAGISARQMEVDVDYDFD